MSIIYYLDFPCAVKEQIRPGRMLRLLYGRERANEEMNRARKAKPDAAAEDVRVELSLKDADGTVNLVATTAADIERQYAELDRHSHHCIDCRARIEAQSFGCRGRIDFPFTLKAETLLMQRVRASGGDPTASMLANYFENNGISGNRAGDMRNLHGVFFESTMPLVRRLTDGRKVSSNQVFELFFQTGQVGPKHARFLLGMFDLLAPNLPIDRPLQSLPNLFVVEREDSGMVVQRIGLSIVAGEEERCTRQLENYFGGLLLASELGHDLWVKI